MRIPTTAVQEEGVQKALDVTSRLLQAQEGNLFHGLILTGSASRGEATIVQHDNRFVWMSDVECLVPIAHKRDLPEARQRLTAVTKAIDAEMADCGHDVEVELTPAPTAYFVGLDPHLFSVELKHFGRQIFGDQEYLGLIPNLDPNAIRPEEAWRLLSNRLVEDLGRRVGQRQGRTIDRIYGDVKLAIDLLTAFSILSNCYAPSYRERYSNRETILDRAQDLGLDPELLAAYRRLLDQAMEFKTTGCTGDAWSRYPVDRLWSESEGNWYDADASQWDDWRRLSDVATASWLIHLNLVTKSHAASGLGPSLQPLNRVQAPSSSLRAWLAAIVKSPSHQRMTLVRQAIRLGRQGSPRALTYGCAWALLSNVYPQDVRTRWVAEHLPTGRINAQAPDVWAAQGQACVKFWREVLRMSAA